MRITDQQDPRFCLPATLLALGYRYVLLCSLYLNIRYLNTGPHACVTLSHSPSPGNVLPYVIRNSEGLFSGFQEAASSH